MIDPLWLMLIGMVVVLGGILVLRLHAFLALMLGAIIVGSLTSGAALRQYALDKNMTTAATETLVRQSTGERIAIAFGQTCTKIGILIAMASIIGKCLLESGAAERIIRSALKRFGESRAPLAFLSSGFLLAIPVYFDTVFYLMIPLAKAMGMRTRRNYGLYVMAIVAGGTMAHSLVPPTPGPLFVAGELSVSLGLMILGGIIIGLFTASSGYAYALWANRRWPIVLRDSADISAAELEALSNKDERELPPLWLSVLPILLPVVLIAGQTIVGSFFKGPSTGESSEVIDRLLDLLDYLGNPNIALALAAAIALATLTFRQNTDRKKIAAFVQSALSSAGVIILITSAGGAFGGILQQTGIGPRIQELASTHQLAVLPLAFVVTAVVRTAQGSATVAMITAIGIMGGFANAGQLGFHPVYLALVIGCGSKPIAWMNDSGFWLICKMTGMTEAETLKLSSAMMVVMALVGLVVIMIFARLLPLV